MNARRVTRRLATFLALALIAAPFAVPGRAAGAGSEQTRSVAPFVRVRLQGAFVADITSGAAGQRVAVSAAPDIVDRVTTTVHDGELLVAMKPGTNNLSGSSPMLTIAVPVLRGFANEGAGTVKIAGLTGGDVEISNAGTGTITAAGKADTVTISLDGTGRIDTTGLAARDVSVDNNGVGSIRVRASGILTMAVNGVGEIRYTGNPAKIERQVNGIGRISPL